MDQSKIISVLSENLNEGYRIIYEDESLSPSIEWVDWVSQSDDEEDYIVEVTFSDDSTKTFPKGVNLRQIWHEDI